VKDNRMFVWAIGAVLAFAAIAGFAAAANGQRAAANPSGGQQWLAAMDTDKDGTVSKKEFNTYMDAQFKKADVDHDGTLNAQELDQLRKSLAIATE
jgi:hypothetical protein